MYNYKIIIEFDGCQFFGWQLQNGKRTVQGEIENALRILSNGISVRIHGAGRTDTNVHALGQCANFFLDKEWNPEKLSQAINANVGRDVQILSCTRVPKTFHARFSAKRRSYFYKCDMSNSVLRRHYAWGLKENFSIERLQLCAGLLLGIHDFSNFSKTTYNKGHRFCEILFSRWKKQHDFVIYEIEANRFLHHMIRYLVGTMIDVGSNKLSVEQFQLLLNLDESKQKVRKAPPFGLYLKKITY